MSTSDEATMNGSEEPRRRRFRMPSLSVQIFIALGLGLAAGSVLR